MNAAIKHLWIVCIATVITVASSSSSLPSSSNKNGNEIESSHILAALPNGDNVGAHDLTHLIFQPSLLDFQELSIGDADSNVVTVINKHANRSVYMGAISGNVPDFYSSFFEEKVIPPMGNTTFNVVFLPRQQGPIQSQLVIHTSFGAINYTVKGKGVECLFRLNPLVGLRAPFNATLTPEIYMYNPFSSPLQIMEVYSSGGQFHLELPSGGQEAPQNLWEIPPYCSKPIIRVRFTATVPGNHTAYIRIKISSGNDSELENVVLVVPIEVEITNHHGIYSKIPILNFGLAGSRDIPKKIIFKLYNSGRDPIEIKTYSVEGDADVTQGVSVIIWNNVPISDSDGACRIITAVVDWSKIKTDRYFRGHILITTVVNSKQFEYKIPFVGEILKGSIGYNETQTMFIANHGTAVSKDFILKNNFDVALAITNISVPNDFEMYFTAMDFTPTILAPGQETNLLKITQLPATSKKITVRNILLQTNVSVYEIPVSSYSGLLRRIVPVERNIINGIGPDEKAISYGTLPLSTLTDTFLAFVNDNPQPVSIHNWKGTMSGVASIVIILRGCGKLTMHHLKYCIAIQPGEWIVFQISVLSNAVGSFVGNFFLKTDYEEISTPVRFTTAIGRVEFTAVMVKEDECFPGGVCSADITAHSTFHETINVEEILVNVTGLTYDYVNMKFPSIQPNELTHIGQFLLNPRPICGDECYLEFPDKLAPSIISFNCKATEKDLMSLKLEYYRMMKQSFQSISYQVKITQHKRYEFNGSANLHWPRLVHETVEFPVMQVGSEMTKYVTVTNPSQQTVMAYFVIHDGASGTSMTFPPEIITNCWDCFLTRDNVFALIDTEIKSMKFQLIPPKSSINVAVSFASPYPGKYSTLLYIRNNFTIMEAIWITAQAVVPQFKFGNRKPGSQTPLLFELSDKHLRDCHRKKTDGTPFTVTAKRTFTARNTGDVSIFINRIYIGGEACEGFGFKIIDCEPFELSPNGSRKLEIAFTPDFTLARVTKTLNIATSLNYTINYTLLSMIPAQYLGPCGKALKRPSWELPLQHTLLAVLITSFFLVIVVAYFDSDKVLKDHDVYMAKTKGPTQPALDLRKIGLRNPFAHDSEPKETQSPSAKATPNNVTNYSIMSNGKRSAEKKRNDVGPVESNRKSWATVLAKKFSPIKSDVKFREPPTVPAAVATSPGKSPEQRKEHRKLKENDFCETTPKRTEDDSSSTTTENSTQSSSSSSSSDPEVKVNPATKIKKITVSPVAAVVIPSPESLAEKQKIKQIVKKVKSLPISSSLPESIVSSPPKAVHSGIPAKPMLNGKDIRIQQQRTNSPDTVKTESNHNKTPPAMQTPPPSSGAGHFNSNEKPPSNHRKYGKTPGRERKKNESSRKSMPKAAQPYKGNAFQFTSPLTNSPSTISPPWDTNKITFSNVVAQNHFPKPAAVQSNLSACKCTLPEDSKNPNMDKMMFDGLPDGLPTDQSTNKTYMDLGPIGSRKSPQSTPVWEPMPSIEKPVATLNGNSNSFFSGSFPYYQANASNYMASKTPVSDMDLGGASGLLDTVYGEQTKPSKRVWDSALLLTVLQQQQQQEEDINSYPSIYTNTNSLWSSDNKAWFQGSSSAIRPPPGLEPLRRDKPNCTMDQQQQENSLPQFDPFSSLSSIWSTDSLTNSNKSKANTNLNNNNNNGNKQ